MRILKVLIIIIGASANAIAQDINYQENLNLAIELTITKSEIPDTILLGTIPYSNEQFAMLYNPASPENKLEKTQFFHDLTQMIFNKVLVEQNESFYSPALELASYADGEYAEYFIENLNKIIKIDQTKFCNAIKGHGYVLRNPIKYYSEEYNCN